MNKLEKAIGSGKKVTGMKGYIRAGAADRDSYVNTSQTLYVPITILGVTTSGCELKIRAKVDEPAMGEFTINACQFLDDLNAIHELIANKKLEATVSAEQKKLVHGSVSFAKQRIKSFVREFSAPEFETFINEALENEFVRPREGRNLFEERGEWEKQLTAQNLKTISQLAAEVKHGAVGINEKEDENNDWDD